MTYLFKRSPFSLGEVEVHDGEDEDKVEGGEKDIGTPSDIRKHGSSDHDLETSVYAPMSQRGVTCDKEVEQPVRCSGETICRLDRSAASFSVGGSLTARIRRGVISAG